MTEFAPAAGSKGGWKKIGCFFVFLLFLLLSVHLEKGYLGVVRDLHSGAPLSGVLVFRELRLDSPSPAGGHSVFFRGDEALSDSQGVFSLPSRFRIHFPLLTWVTRNYTFLKAGYFPIDSAENAARITFMRRKKFRSEFPEWAANHFPSLLSLEISSLAKNHTRYIEESRKIFLRTAAPSGQFFRSAGSRFMNMICFPDSGGDLLVFDGSCGGWRKLSMFGDELIEGSVKLPSCDVLAPLKFSEDVVYFRDGQIHFPIQSEGFENRAVPRNHDYLARKPSFSAVIDLCLGKYYNIMTVESEGTMLCGYLFKDWYPQKMVLGRSWKVESLLRAEPGAGGIPWRLRFIRMPSDLEFGLITRAGDQWRIYRIESQFQDNAQPICIGQFKEVREISAALFACGSLYVAIAGGGVRRFITPFGNDANPGAFHEDPPFAAHLREAGLTVVRGMATGLGGHPLERFIYMTDGGDTIYRFNHEGIPDVQVRFGGDDPSP